MTQTNKSINVPSIDYTKTSFNQIKEKLVEHIKRYYPDTYRDFKKSSFGSLMLDLVSYVGDQLHYYIDHNINESIPAYTTDPENLIQIIQSMVGTPPTINPSSFGHLDVSILAPADSFGVGIDSSYLNMELRAGSIFQSVGGTQYTQTQDITLNETTSQIVGYNTTADGSKVQYFAMKAKVPVISGREKTFTVDIGPEYKRFRKIEIPDSAITEILKVTDSEGREYFQVDHLTQNVIYKPIRDPESRDTMVSSIMKAVPVPRRFVIERGLDKTCIVFGYGSDNDLKTNSVADPSKLALKMSGKNYVSSTSLDPMRLMASDTLGVAPRNTTLTITYRSNTSANANSAVGTVNQVVSPVISFRNEHLLDQAKVNFIRDNVEVYNEDAINGSVSIPTTEELRRRYLGTFGAQNRAVTKQDYVTSVYSMPGIYGSIKRASVVRDNNDLRRNLNMYLISEDGLGKLQAPSTLLKQNVKTWLDSVRMISDSVDLFDAKIINLGIEFVCSLKDSANRQTTLSLIKSRIFEELTTIPPEIGESFLLSNVIRIIQSMPEVNSVPLKGGVKVTSLVGENYTDYYYDIKNNTSENSLIYIPMNSIWEIKYIDDIKGSIIG